MRSPCSCVGILAAVLCVLCGGIEEVGGGWQTSPSHYTVGTHGWILVGGGCYSYIRFDSSLEVHNVFHYVPNPLPPTHTALCSEQWSELNCE
jgi:hypothetical protein